MVSVGNLWCLRYILYRRRWLGTTPMGKNLFTKDGLCEFNNSILLVSGIAGFTVSSLIHAVGYILILHIYLHILILLMIGCISPWYPTSNGWATSRTEAYKRSDIVMVDNHRIGHGREIYLGPKTSRLKHGNPSWVPMDRHPHTHMTGGCYPRVDLLVNLSVWTSMNQPTLSHTHADRW